jgi:hypothetical protein
MVRCLDWLADLARAEMPAARRAIAGDLGPGLTGISKSFPPIRARRRAMTFDPERRNPDVDSRLWERNHAVLMLLFVFVLFGSWNTSPTTTTRESNVRTEAPVRTVPQAPPATVPKAPN